MNVYMFWINFILMVGLIPTHLWRGPARTPFSRKVLFTMIVIWLMYWVYIGFQSKVSLGEVMLALGSYCAALFVFLSELLMTGGAALLTKKLGENWIKEIDYIYLAFGALGLIASLGQLEFVSDKFTPPGILAPFLIATAIVVRTVRTRAEIAGWNKA